MPTEVELLGHKATIEKVFSQPRLEPWYKEDQLAVWIHFDEPVDGIVSFPVLLPAKKYADREEFLYNVCRRGEKELGRALMSQALERKERKDKAERKAAVDALAAEAQSLIE